MNAIGAADLFWSEDPLPTPLETRPLQVRPRPASVDDSIDIDAALAIPVRPRGEYLGLGRVTRRGERRVSRDD
jgi:hypothetical protein